MTVQDVAVLREEVPARVDDDVLDLVGWSDVHLRDIRQSEVDLDPVRVESVAP